MIRSALMQRTAAWIALVWAAAAAAPAFSPEQHLPASTILYIDVSLGSDTMQRIRNCSLWKLWEDPEVQRFLEKSIQQMRADYGKWLEIMEEDPGLDLRPLVKLMPPRRACLAITALDREEWEPKVMAVGVDWGDTIDAVRTELDRLLEFAKKRAAEKDHKIVFTERESDGTTIRRVVRSWEEEKITLESVGALLEGITVDASGEVVMEPGETAESVKVGGHRVFEFAFVGSALLAVFGEDPEDEELALERYLAPEKPLSKNAEFQSVRKKVSGSLPFVYERIDTVLEALEKQVAEEQEADDEFDFEALMEALGVAGMKSLVYGQDLVDGDIVDHLYVVSPAPRRGILAALTGTPLPRERLARFAPPTAHMYGEASFDMTAVWEFVGQLVAAVTDDAGEKRFRDGVASVEEKMGTTFAELFASFDSRAAGYLSYPENLSSLGMQGLILPLKQTDTVRSVLTKLRSLPEATEVLFFKDETYQGVKTVSMTFRNLTLPFMPSYAFFEDTLIITENPFSLKKLIASLKGDGGSLADAEKFKALAGKAFPEGASYGMYTDLPDMVERLYGAIVPMVSMVMATPSARQQLAEMRLDLNLLPSAKAVARHLRPGWEYVRVDEQGIEYRGRSSVGAGIVGLYKTAVGAVLPFIGAAAMRSTIAEHYKKGSRENLTKLYDAIGVYRKTVGGGRNPRDLLALLSAGLIEEKHLVAPGDDKPRKVEDPETGDPIAMSYRYRPAGFGEKGTGLVLYEAGTWYGGERRLGLFKDGRIRTIWSEERLERLLKGGE